MEHKFGTDPVTGRALNRDGTVRKQRTTLTAAEKAAKAREAVLSAAKSLGRDAIKSVNSLAGFLSGIGTFRKWAKDAVAYSTEEKRAAKRTYFEAQIAAIEGKGAAAEAWLPTAESALSGLSSFEADVGDAVMAFMEENGREPNADEAEAIVRDFLSDEVRTLVEGCADPDSDPFRDYRRGATSDDTEDNDTL